MSSSHNKPDSSIGIVMPCYNLGPYLDEAIKSVLSQTYKNFRVYIVDDASTEKETLTKLHELESSLPSNFVVDYQTKNRGMHRVTN